MEEEVVLRDKYGRRNGKHLRGGREPCLGPLRKGGLQDDRRRRQLLDEAAKAEPENKNQQVEPQDIDDELSQSMAQVIEDELSQAAAQDTVQEQKEETGEGKKKKKKKLRAQ